MPRNEIFVIGLVPLQKSIKDGNERGVFYFTYSATFVERVIFCSLASNKEILKS